MKAISITNTYVSKRVIYMSAASLALAVVVGFSALVRIPLPGTPVPVTLQTFALLASAGILGRYYALQMVGWYLVLGVVGAPFFAGGSGAAHLVGPTAGYLLGFVIASAVVGFMRGEGVLRGMAVYLCAALAIYVPGLVWLHLSTATTWSQTIAMGFLPFIVADMLKAIAAWVGVRALKK
jgi:biotin transport system substrate-specific component